jgi:YVTN family beta-propeller protein
MDISRRAVLKATAFGALGMAGGIRLAAAQTGQGASAVEPNDRIFIANEDSNTISVIDPRTNAVDTTINLTSFDEDPRPPFRFVTGGVMPTHSTMIHKPLYHGAIDIHGVVPSPDGKLLATAGRGTSNLYLIDSLAKRVIGNTPNPQAGTSTNPERLSSGILVGREPHEPTFTRNGKEIGSPSSTSRRPSSRAAARPLAWYGCTSPRSTGRLRSGSPPTAAWRSW